MLLLLIIFITLTSADILPNFNPQQIPIISEPKTTCSCGTEDGTSAKLCQGGLYVDYYYNAPYSGYPKDPSYLPPVDSVPVIIEKLTSIRDSVKAFVQGVNSQDSNAQKALYVKNNFDDVKFLLKAVDKAAKTSNTIETP